MEQECIYNKSYFLYEKQFNFFKHKKIFFTIAKVFDHAIELGSDFALIKNNGRLEISYTLSLLRRVIIINMHDKRIGYKSEEEKHEHI